MVVSTQGGGSGSGFGAKLIDERIREFITSKITHDILHVTPVMFGTIKEGIWS